MLAICYYFPYGGGGSTQQDTSTYAAVDMRVHFEEYTAKYSGLADEDVGEPNSDGEAALDADGAGASSDESPSMLFLLMINSFGFSYGLTVSTLGLVILPSEAIHLYHDRCPAHKHATA